VAFWLGCNSNIFHISSLFTSPCAQVQDYGITTSLVRCTRKSLAAGVYYSLLWHMEIACFENGMGVDQFDGGGALN
jgi:hypothetical protein